MIRKPSPRSCRRSSATAIRPPSMFWDHRTGHCGHDRQPSGDDHGGVVPTISLASVGHQLGKPRFSGKRPVISTTSGAIRLAAISRRGRIQFGRCRRRVVRDWSCDTGDFLPDRPARPRSSGTPCPTGAQICPKNSRTTTNPMIGAIPINH